MAEATAIAAEARNESRGAHARDDFRNEMMATGYVIQCITQRKNLWVSEL